MISHVARCFKEVGDKKPLGGMIVQAYYDELILEWEEKQGRRARNAEVVPAALSSFMHTICDLQLLYKKNLVGSARDHMLNALEYTVTLIQKPITGDLTKASNN